MTDASPELEALRTALAAAEARAMVSGNEAVIATLKLEIEKLKRALYGQKSERRARLLDQLELQLEELEAAATEDELAAENAAAQVKIAVRAFRAPPPGAQAVSGAPAARAGGDRGADSLRWLAARTGSSRWARTSPRRSR